MSPMWLLAAPLLLVAFFVGVEIGLWLARRGKR